MIRTPRGKGRSALNATHGRTMAAATVSRMMGPSKSMGQLRARRPPLGCATVFVWCVEPAAAGVGGPADPFELRDALGAPGDFSGTQAQSGGGPQRPPA